MFCHGHREDRREKKNGMSAPWLKLNIENLCLELSRKKGFLGEVSCPQPVVQNASLGATSVLWGYDTQSPGAKKGKKKYSLPPQRWVWVPHTPEVWGSLNGLLWPVTGTGSNRYYLNANPNSHRFLAVIWLGDFLLFHKRKRNKK